MLADFDRDVVAIASQPFGLTGRDHDTIRRHVPDYLLVSRDRSAVVIDVKPANQVDRPEVAPVLQWTGRLLAERGWRYEVWSSAEEVLLTNVRFVAQGRHPRLVDPGALAALADTGAPGMCLDDAITAASQHAHVRGLRAALMVLLWEQVWTVDLFEPLGGTTLITSTRQVAS